MASSTLADANKKRNWHIYAELAQVLIAEAGVLGLDQTAYALDSTTIDLCLSLFLWAQFRSTKGAVKLHTLLDLRGSTPAFAWITDGKVADTEILDLLIPEPGGISILDRDHIDFERLYSLTGARAIFSYQGQEQPEPSQAQLAQGGQVHRPQLRSDDRTHWPGDEETLPQGTAPRPLQGPREWEGIYLPNQPIDFTAPALMIPELYKSR